MKPITKIFLSAIFITSLISQANAQFTATAQLRTRTELRSGQGAPIPQDSAAAFFTSQRTRVILGYSTYRLKFGLTMQDVRVWGQDVSSINRTTTANNNGLLVQEAWAEIGLLDTINKKENFALKIGRQELMYDDQRLLGNLDWVQQGRRHDAAVFKYTTASWMLHLGVAFNQNAEKGIGTIYNETSPGNYTNNTNGGAMYKSFQYLYLGKKLKEGNVSFLAFTDEFNQYHVTTGVTTWDIGTWTRITTGLYLNNNFGKLGVTASAYYQGGKNSSGLDLNAGFLSFATQYNFTKKISVGPGLDYSTGGANATQSSVFDPLYGTPHKFHGNMDYFYTANGFGGKGLQDYYIKSKWKPSAKFQLNVDVHEFASASNVHDASGNLMTRNFGTELDMVGNYSLTNIVSFEAGYSHFFATGTLTSPQVKNITNARSNNNWAYVMIIIKPDFLSK